MSQSEAICYMGLVQISHGRQPTLPLRTQSRHQIARFHLVNPIEIYDITALITEH